MKTWTNIISLIQQKLKRWFETLFKCSKKPPCIDIDPLIKPMEQREEIKKENNTTAISNRNSLKSLSSSLYLFVHSMDCVQCVRPKAYLYNLTWKKTIRRVVSFFPTNGICSTVFRPKELFCQQKDLETVQFWRFLLDFSLSAEILFRPKKGNSNWKLKLENCPKLN